MLGYHPPRSWHPPGSRHPPEQTPPRSRHSPGAGTPREQASPRADNPLPAQCMLGDTVNKRVVCILLECNLVYQPQRSCGQGNVFTGVCHSFCSQGGLQKPPLLGPGRTPLGPRRPPWTKETPLGPRRPPQTKETPRTKETPPRPRRTPLDQGDPPGPRRRRTPPDPGDPPTGRRLQHTVNERPVRILLECILVATCGSSINFLQSKLKRITRCLPYFT